MLRCLDHEMFLDRVELDRAKDKRWLSCGPVVGVEYHSWLRIGDCVVYIACLLAGRLTWVHDFSLVGLSRTEFKLYAVIDVPPDPHLSAHLNCGADGTFQSSTTPPKALLAH
jgi:hypothetical protein